MYYINSNEVELIADPRLYSNSLRSTFNDLGRLATECVSSPASSRPSMESVSLRLIDIYEKIYGVSSSGEIRRSGSVSSSRRTHSSGEDGEPASILRALRALKSTPNRGRPALSTQDEMWKEVLED